MPEQLSNRAAKALLGTEEASRKEGRGKRDGAPVPLGLKEPQIHVHLMDKQRDAGGRLHGHCR